MIKGKKIAIKTLTLAIVISFISAVFIGNFKVNAEYGNPSYSYVSSVNDTIKTNQENYYDSSAIYKLPETINEYEDISVIVTMDTKSVLEAFNETTGYDTVSDFALTKAAKDVSRSVAADRNSLIRTLYNSGINFTLGDEYETIFSGFEITIKAKDFEKVNKLLSSKATLIVGEVYEQAKTEIVTNDVDVYETGIFDSSSSQYQGDGVVVAVLDTGLDYTHTAFSVDNFTTDTEAFTLQNVSEKVSGTAAAGFTSGLTGEDVYVNKKVPFAYDYADKDADVLPINSDHGTHVAGIIAGKDDTITGVAPNAQLAIMKVFSDTAEGAKSSAILSALEDCVILGVDAINMSLGSGCGFTREVDNEKVNNIYDSIRDAGISLIASAANSYNATMGSDKNGSNGLTSNPDSGTVGSPSTYEAALSIASVDGVKTPYILYGEQIIYFTEASTSSSTKKAFVNDVLATLGSDVTSHDFEYVTIPGVGRSSDYSKENSYYQGKIVLVKRGKTNFEDKVRVALVEKGAAGIIIYNNVSGTISMSVGANIGAVCSIAQDEGELLAQNETGIIRISKEQVAGPFMSDFSSWGPTSDLRIKPEITAHGGEILSAVPGQGYERLSGTSMAAPNQAGATALIRQYVKYSGVFGTNLTTKEITALVNQLMMSTADIVYNKNGLPYAVRKQGAGLMSITKSTTTAAYITTFDKSGASMDKTKIELGDDKKETGVYEMTFDINNITGKKISYNIDSVMISEGVSKTYTSHGDTTVTQDGYLLSGSKTSVTAVKNGSNSGNTVSIEANQSAKVTVKIELSEADKKYIRDSFKYGMYVEGFVTLKAQEGTTVDMNIPVLAFFGDWTKAPIFDEEYYDTNKDEINAGLDDEDKLMPDAYATRVIGGLYSDYIATLGSYYFQQDPSATQIAASKEHIAISNNESSTNTTISSLRSISAGMLRNAKEVNIRVVEDSTGREIFNKTGYNQRKSFTNGSTIYASSIEIDFSALEKNLKNNTKYTVYATTYIDYGSKTEQQNVRNTFEFPLFIDFEAPVITDVTYRTEYDKTTKKTKLFADLSVYDNHYAMGLQIGQIAPADPASGYSFTMNSFGKYVTPVYSQFNSTSKVTVELTDYLADLKNSAGLNHTVSGSNGIVYNNNSFIVNCYDYAMNSATYEIRLPDEIKSMYFSEETINLSPNETKDLSSILNIYPNESWMQVLDFKSDDVDIADVVNQTIVAKTSGDAIITAEGRDGDGNLVTATLKVHVLSEGEEGYKGGYTIPEVNKFTLTGYKTNKAYYSISSDDRKIGVTGGSYEFDGNYSLSMYPSESVSLKYKLDSYFPGRTAVVFKSGNSKVATVSEDGTLVALAEGSTIVSVYVTFDGKTTLYSGRVAITVKDPFITNSIYLTAYKGLGGTVQIPADRGITTINSYAFSNYNYVEKDVANGDVIDEEDPYYIKQMYIGEDTITKVIIPEGVTEIAAYAFAKLTALEEVVLPSTLTKIGLGAFYGCDKLKTINLNKVKFINEKAFAECALEEVNLSSVVAIGNYTFMNCKLNYVVLPESSQSLGIGAFYKNAYLTSVEFKASKIKIGSLAFAECPELTAIDINAAVISSYAFNNSTKLTKVNLGKDVAVIGEFAFAGTNVSSFTLDPLNTALSLDRNGAFIYKGTELLLAAPQYSGTANTITIDAESIATGAFAGNVKIFNVNAFNVKTVGAYAFANCSNLKQVTMNNVEEIGDYAFIQTAITATPNLENVSKIGKYAFANTNITTLDVADNTEIGNYAFAYCVKLDNVTIGDYVTVGEAAFYCPIYSYTYDQTEKFDHYTAYTYEVTDGDGKVVASYTYYRYNFMSGVFSKLKTVTIGDGVTIGNRAFSGNANMTTLTFGDGAIIGDYAFFNDLSLTSVDLSQVKSIGQFAFAGTTEREFMIKDNTLYLAFRMEYIDGKVVPKDYMYTSFAPMFTEADLTNCTSVGVGAFTNNTALKTVTFGDKITSIPNNAFANCSSLNSVTLPSEVTSIGDYAFSGTAINTVDLSNVLSVGKYAFASTNLTSTKLKTGVNLADGAFAYNDKLSVVENLENANTIGAYAFSGSALKEVTLTNATSIGDFAFSQSQITKVTFGDKLVTLGENPFFACNVKTFAKEENLTFNGNVIGTQNVATYDVSETVKVINGVLYQVVPKGLELVSYPMANEEKTYVVEEGTVRISARAFAGSVLQNVTLASTLNALGDKAFFGCEKLAIVVFKGYNAPTLEEEYNKSYMSYENLALSGYMNSGTQSFEGLGISKFYMWNAASNSSNYYFGANFVNYIGKIENNIVMVKPVNGQNYDTFIFSQYFGTTVTGSSAATTDTLNVIDMINKLPQSITLAVEDLVVEARNAYNKIPSLEQQALVANVSKLNDAEATIKYLKSQIAPVDPIEPEKPSENGFAKFMKNNYIGLIIAGVAVIALVAYIAVSETRKKSNKN